MKSTASMHERLRAQFILFHLFQNPHGFELELDLISDSQTPSYNSMWKHTITREGCTINTISIILCSPVLKIDVK